MKILNGPPTVVKGMLTVPKHAIHLVYHDTIVEGIFNCSGTKITSLRGCPKKVTLSFSCSRTAISSLKGCPKEVGGEFYCQETNILSLHMIHRQIYRIGENLHISDTVRSHILGILKIREVQYIRNEHYHDTSNKLTAALNIINRYILHIPNPRDRNIHKCQEELIEADLGEFANL